ncbi:MAG: hypothetical protein AAB616_00955 [Patescibacteria group bacterium]
MDKIVTKKEMVSSNVNYLQKKIDRILKSKIEKGFDGEGISMVFYFSNSSVLLIRNIDVKNELIQRYKEAGWDISLEIKRKFDNDNRLYIHLK